MEFKGKSCVRMRKCRLVDIGTEWNLKFTSLSTLERDYGVDIGTEWNLKTLASANVGSLRGVDIGTEWNLKYNYSNNRYYRN